jgi:hypothetical protein
MDLFINALRCSPDVLAVIASSPTAYSLLGILEIEDRGSPGVFKRWSRRIRPILAVPRLNDIGQQQIAEFEHVSEIRRYGRKRDGRNG